MPKKSGQGRRNKERNVSYQRIGKKLRIGIGVPPNTPGTERVNEIQMKGRLKNEHALDPLEEVEFSDEALIDQISLLQMATISEQLGIPTKLKLKKSRKLDLEQILIQPVRQTLGIIEEET
jgi:hypothetical protein